MLRMFNRLAAPDPVAAKKAELDAEIAAGESAGRRLVEIEPEENEALLAGDDNKLDALALEAVRHVWTALRWQGFSDLR